MKKSYVLLIVLFFALAHSEKLSAQDSSVIPKHRIAIFTPLYLDSAFNGNNEYRYADNTFPKFINPGLEFYEGAQLALDSLTKENIPIEVFIYDTRSTKETLSQQLGSATADSVELILTYCTGSEARQLADEGLKRNIPVINANLPNNAGVTNNPFFVVLNATLETQCEGIYKFIQKYYALDRIIMFRKKGRLEDRIKNQFESIGKSTSSIPLKIKYVDLPDNFTVNQLTAQLDSNSRTLCIAGSLDENFGKKLVLQLASIRKHYPLAIMGMPTWDGIKDFIEPEYKGIEIIYSTPFYNAKTDTLSMNINNFFTTRMYARPSDMVFRGYEVTFKFAMLLLQHGRDIASSLNNKQTNIFTDYDIQPVINRQTSTLDYFENKKLYFLKWQDGVIKEIY
ncbi:MAG: amino acid ABC transporter substrate-binding protein [Bacteroidia bacterium]|nr:amino acid ABC transporter substrate-binding protein [Bacteroidia bacterium]